MTNLKSKSLRNGSGCRYLNGYLISRYGKNSYKFYRVTRISEDLQVVEFSPCFKKIEAAEELILSGIIENYKVQRGYLHLNLN